jgi:uncharacterized protein (TIGR04255 family)
MSVRAPKYPNPTIAEAVCDIHFRVKEWKPSLTGEFFKYIQNEYPEMEPVFEMGFQLELGPSGAGTKIIPQAQKMRFKHKDRPIILQLSENAFSISTLPPYQGWEVMRSDAMTAWQQVEEVIKPFVINRIGLRYINRFQKETDQDSPGDWLVATDYIPEGALQSQPGFLLRVQTHLTMDNILIVTLGDFKSEREGNYGSIIFDIDRIAEREILPEQAVVQQEMDRLHSDIWQVFSSAKGMKLDKLLNRRHNEQHQS